ncbi:MAG: RadC family protein [Clostridia bacterium]|nr:RadC family protein [Clostridia bacterium]
MKENVHKGHRERMRQRYLEQGLKGFSDHEVLEMLLFQFLPYKNTNEIAHELINEFGSLASVLDADRDSLVKIKGISQTTATNIALFKDVYLRYNASKTDKESIKSVTDAIKYARNVLAQYPYEQFCAIFLSSDNKILAKREYCDKDVQKVLVTPKQIAQTALNTQATAVIVIHTHPNGVAKPSEADVSFTSKLVQTLQALEVNLLEHLILNNDQLYSFRLSGKLDKIKQEL